MRIDFYLRYRTQFGQTLAVTGNIPALGNGNVEAAFPLGFFNEDFWHGSIDIDPSQAHAIHYHYLLQDASGTRREAEGSRVIDVSRQPSDLVVIDTWNDESAIENAFFTAPFTDVYFRDHRKGKSARGGGTHTFKVKAPLLSSHEAVCLLGSTGSLHDWDTSAPLLMQKRGDWWVLEIDLSGTAFPLTYKYGIYNSREEVFVQFEEGDNRLLHYDIPAEKKTIVHDGFFRRSAMTWKGTGIAIPVFSLRSAGSFGVGEFSDLKLLADWAARVQIRLIQILPINDTSATYSWKDSYPYAAISAFALHPIFINLQKVAGKKGAGTIRALSKKQKQLNALPEIDYEQVIQFKINVLRELFEMDGLSFLKEKEYEDFFSENKDWLVPYAAFCFLRDRYGTADCSKWRDYSVYNADEIGRLTARKSKQYRHIAFFYFVQYHLHLQLKEATDYAHKKGIAVKGDIPIGIYRYGADAWTAPQLYNMDMQAGAPPDDFAIKGQNWGFPTYNWKKMEEDHFEWWRQRFRQMSNYFDAFRIDHILGFFRIWSIPVDAVEGIMGRFIPALPVTASEFGERGIWFDHDRFCKPYINDSILAEVFGEHAPLVKSRFLLRGDDGTYALREEVSTQRKVEAYFEDESEGNTVLRQGLYDLISNVLLFEEGSGSQRYHFRIAIESTPSFRHLDEGVKHKLRELYIDYFYRRQDAFWKEEAMKKLPALKAATHMLVCGEDLGMVPHSVPEVMQQLGILSLEIQRMPKNPHTEFFHPKDAPYLSVVTPSSHDMSTIRGWWEESREKTQRFFNTILGESGTAPYFCESWVNRAIVLQHLYAPAMWSIFQMQDILGMNDHLRRENPHEERINIPANPTHYWNYRMHIPLEQLLKEAAFNNELKDYITNSGRS